MADWVGWLGLAALLGVAEILTLAFAAGVMAVAAVVAAVVAGVGGDFEAQLLAFALTSLAAFAAIVPLARRRRAGSWYRSGTAALIDQPATVVRRVDAVGGAVSIGGDVWSARAYDPTQVIAEGSPVAVFQIEGATALVYTLEQ
jgi:membrane protein implicated in regulation of membrane protease activity